MNKHKQKQEEKQIENNKNKINNKKKTPKPLKHLQQTKRLLITLFENKSKIKM